MKKLILTTILAVSATLAQAATQFVTFDHGTKTALRLTQTDDTIRYDQNDWEGVKIAIRNLRNDLTAVTGSSHAPILIGTIGKSHIAAQYPKQVKQLQGKWEQYIITTTKVKTPNGKRDALLILGSDKRGTIYGIYELSRQIGVSPWYWMADAPIAKHPNLYINKGTYTDGEPKVKYRGIFINDEWPSFGTWCNNQFGGINSKAYSRIFELLLRLKANYFWPAMWDSRFNEDDPLSPKVADDMGIVMGTSHHEPMMRAHKEYTTRRSEVGPWDYSQNPERLDKFFTEGIQHAKPYENIITIGMRGDGDVAMGKGNDADNIKTLGNVIDSQRRIISDVYGRPASELPQLWAIFTEVQRYYDAGFTVPDDVTLLFCDNNWGYIRRIGREAERKRKGGLGMYYHIDMNGGPWNDRWVNTTTVPKLREQLYLAYSTGIDRIWIINVGDLKPKEMPIDFIMNYAWNPDAIRPGDEIKYMQNFASSIFGTEHSEEIADIIAKYSKYNLWRKPEVQYPGIFNFKEMQQTDSLWDALTTRVEALRSKISVEAQDAFYQLVYYPVMGSAGVARIYNECTRGDSLAIERLMLRDKQLTDYYNKELAHGKWNGMMLDNHIGYTQWSIPQKNVNPMSLKFKVNHNLTAADRPTHEYSIPAYEYNNKVDTKSAKWQFLPDLGRGKGCMGIDNTLAKSDTTGNGPFLSYEVRLTDGKVALGILPTQDVYPDRGLRIGVKIDDEPMQIIDARQGLHDEFREYTQQNLAVSKVLKPLPRPGSLALSGYYEGRRQPRRDEVFDNMRWLTLTFNTVPGTHTLSIIMIDPEIVLEQLVINPDNNHYSYFGGLAL